MIRSTVLVDGEENPLICRTAVAGDSPVIGLLAKMESNRVGFIPSAGLATYVDNGWAFVAEVQGVAVGYLLGRPSLRCARFVRPVTQLVVLPQFRRCGIGSALLTAVAAAALADGRHALQAWTRADLPANWFFAARGWVVIGERESTSARSHPMICRRLSLTAVPHVGLLDLPKNAGHKGRRIRPTAVTPQMRLF